MKQYYLGDTIEIDALLKSGTLAKNLTGATIAVAVLDDKKAVLINPSPLAIDGDPALGHVIGSIPSSSTRLAKVPAKAYLEIESNIAGVITTYGQEEIQFTASPVIT
jgi:hypothetical protein